MHSPCTPDMPTVGVSIQDAFAYSKDKIDFASVTSFAQSLVSPFSCSHSGSPGQCADGDLDLMPLLVFQNVYLISRIML